MSLPMCCGFVRFSANNGRTGNSNHPGKRILTERHLETPKVAEAFQYFTTKYICLFALLHAIIICQLPSNVKLFPVFPQISPVLRFGRFLSEISCELSQKQYPKFGNPIEISSFLLILWQEISAPLPWLLPSRRRFIRVFNKALKSALLKTRIRPLFCFHSSPVFPEKAGNLWWKTTQAMPAERKSRFSPKTGVLSRKTTIRREFK